MLVAKFVAILVVATVFEGAVVVGATRLTSRISRAVVRGLVASAAGLLLAVVPLAIEHLAWRLRGHRYGWFVDVHLIFLAPPLIVAVVAAFWLHRANRAALPEIILITWLAAFGLLNTVNRCSPGWCGWYGFPLTYFEWSDAEMSFNGEKPDRFHQSAVAVNIAVASSGAIILYASALHAARRTREQNSRR